MRKTKLIVLTMILAIALSVSMRLPAEAEQTTLHSWDTKIDDAGKRFAVLANFNNEAVLDRETGLVWEKAPYCSDTPNGCINFDFLEHAKTHCASRNVGNRLGWRLPTIQELLSLVDPSNGGLPAGHPFFGGLPGTTGILTSTFWSATHWLPNYVTLNYVWIADFSGHSTYGFSTLDSWSSTEGGHFAWCVRSGQGVELQ